MSFFDDIYEPQNPMTYKVYVRTDEQSRIIAVNSSAFLTDTEGWTLIDEGADWPKYMHAQGNYFPDPIYTDDGLCRYKLEDGVAMERTEEELEAERADAPAPAPSNEERIADLEEALNLILSGDTGEVADEA